MGKECAEHSSAGGSTPSTDKGDYPFTCECGWNIPIKDVAWIAVQEVTHVICYNCGKEWVE